MSGGVGDFLKVPENGEIKPDIPRTELLPSRKLDTYGKQFSMTRQAFINDDIGFLTKVPGLYATAAKKTIDRQVYKLLYDNTTIFDGVTLFHNSHKNLISSGSAPTQQAIQKMILQMQKQTDQFGDAIYITPRSIVVPVGYEFDLAVILRSAQVVGSANNDINPLYNPCVRRQKDGTLLIQPETGKPYVDRKKLFRYKISRSDLCYRLFTRYGFRWGGDWRSLKDYQHFEK